MGTAQSSVRGRKSSFAKSDRTSQPSLARTFLSAAFITLLLSSSLLSLLMGREALQDLWQMMSHRGKKHGGCGSRQACVRVFSLTPVLGLPSHLMAEPDAVLGALGGLWGREVWPS